MLSPAITAKNSPSLGNSVVTRDNQEQILCLVPTNINQERVDLMADKKRMTERTFKALLINKRGESSLKAYVRHILTLSPEKFNQFVSKRG